VGAFEDVQRCPLYGRFRANAGISQKFRKRSCSNKKLEWDDDIIPRWCCEQRREFPGPALVKIAFV
jgi:hypothetical protein